MCPRSFPEGSSMKYVSMPKRISSRWIADLDAETILPDSVTVYEEDGDLIETGLLDEKGNPLFRLRNPIGFFKE